MISRTLHRPLILQINRKGLCSAVSQADYEKAAEESLERLSDYLDTLPDKLQVSPDYDVTNAMGVLTVVISKQVGTYVINKQSPNRQLWLSSPISGPKRYDLVNHRWVYSRDDEALDTLLTREFRNLFGTDEINFRNIL
ncbi:Frataxin mitochondrial [Trichostrongylus colubriformis]|uniref:ferroxidase n=1 Tax=Trichostrongylus colubriformis TaxID=6319 RepID=A0AAN8IJS4_TRICO